MYDEYEISMRLVGQEKKIVLCIAVIFLCLTSVVGATFALFTSDPKDGTIGINATAGNLEVDLVSSEHRSLVNETLKFVTTQTGEIFFEPGAKFYTQGFMVKNTGNIPINYRIYISPDKDIDMVAFSRAFDFYITTDPKDPNADTDIKEFKGFLKADDVSEMYYLVIRMHEDAGNTFQTQTYDGIGITVYAVQGNVEIEE